MNRKKLLAHLNILYDGDIVLKGKRKSIQKGFPADQADFRGSRYRGVSKNKGKWQVGLFLRPRFSKLYFIKSSKISESS
jgi:hypothetical protein